MHASPSNALIRTLRQPLEDALGNNSVSIDRNTTLIAPKKLIARWHTVDGKRLCRWELDY
ncbi:MAG: hypothetical protein AAGA75_05670 [Cyanobacteria bacterium P01_E01_bin.6]